MQMSKIIQGDEEKDQEEKEAQEIEKASPGRHLGIAPGRIGAHEQHQ